MLAWRVPDDVAKLLCDVPGAGKEVGLSLSELLFAKERLELPVIPQQRLRLIDQFLSLLCEN